MPIEAVAKHLERLGGVAPLQLSDDEQFVVCRRGAHGWRGDERITLRELNRPPRKASEATGFGVAVVAAGGRVLAAMLSQKSRVAGGVLLGPDAHGKWSYLGDLETWQSNERTLDNVPLTRTRVLQYRPDRRVIRVYPILR